MSTNLLKPDTLLIAVVQAQDSDLVELVLGQEKFKFTRLPSVGGFLRERNVTFLIGCLRKDQQRIQILLADAAKRRVSFVAVPTEGGSLPIPIPSETMVGGVSIFSLDLEHFEEI
ncbi:MAG: cyclic-di-AMP receptor [Anaerolineaceae bacterium]|jgi:uncharacterized protein YaaQ